jgi:hypothetical protein
MDIVEVVSIIDEIIYLHNQFFSSVWGQMKEVEKQMRLQESLLLRRFEEQNRQRIIANVPSLVGKHVIFL